MEDSDHDEALATRLWVAVPLHAGAPVPLDPQQTHYLRNVLRLKPGAELSVFNGADGEWTARLDTIGKHAAMLQILAQRRRQSEDRPSVVCSLAFAPIKRARIDFLVEKATELGVARLYPIWTERTNVARLNLERLAAHAREAAEQCERLSVPEIAPPQSLDQLLNIKAPDGPSGRILLCDETGRGINIADFLRAEPVSRVAAAEGWNQEDWTILIGPEGGWSSRELDRFENMSNVARVGLGPRVLRADTAALAALAVFQALRGDWSERRSRAHDLP